MEHSANIMLCGGMLMNRSDRWSWPDVVLYFAFIPPPPVRERMLSHWRFAGRAGVEAQDG